MSNFVSITGRLGQDPEVRFTPNGKAVANGSVADTPRRFNRDTQQWEDAGETLWLRWSLWGSKGEAFAETARKGDLVTLTGRLKARSFEHDSQRREVIELDVQDGGVVPRQAPAQAPSASSGDAWGTGQPPTEAPF